MATNNEFNRGNILGADALMGGVPQWICVGSDRARIGVTGTVASSTMTGRMVFFDSVGNLVGTSTSVTFTCVALADIGSIYSTTPSSASDFYISGAYAFGFKVDGVTGSSPSFAVWARANFPGQPQ